jgi:hypothetical protein
MAFRCPSPADVLNATLALLPRGRAWQNNEGRPSPGATPGFNPLAFNPDAFSTRTERTSVLMQFWEAVSEVYYFLSKRVCDLRLEFWCATQSETRDLWMQEYGLPDACDPFPELCAKVAAIGGARCEYYQFIAERAGWRLICVDGLNLCGARPGSGRAKAGRAMPGRARGAGYIKVLVDLFNSPAICTTYRNRKPKAGRFKAGRRLSCEWNSADISPLECLLARVVHAEVVIDYEAINLTPVQPPPPTDELPEPPANYAYMIDLDGAFVVDLDGQNIMVEAT